MTPTAADLFAVLEATWPAAAYHRQDGWLLREGQGGGQRVSAATWDGPGLPDIAAAEAGMARLGQPPLFMLRAGDAALDAELAGRGYHVHDPVVLYLGRCSEIVGPGIAPLAAFALWPPLEIARRIWDEAGVGAARQAVMARVSVPKTAILGRCGVRSAGVAFAAVQGQVAMLHALEVVPALRRQGTAVSIVRKAALWAQDEGATWLSLAVTEANAPARHLYASLGMAIVGHYHYRRK